MARYFLVSKRLFSTSRSVSNVFNHVVIVGGGLMGSGIAQVTAQAGMDVTIVELNEEAAKRSDSNIKNSMQRVAKKLFQNSSSEAQKYISETMGRLKFSTDLPGTIAKSDLVVEAIVESLPEKHRLFSQIDLLAPDHTIFASNTSSLPISEIAAVTNRKDRFGGLHFFNPVPVMKLLEVIRIPETSEETYQKMMSWGRAIGKTCITCKDTPGFVVNRLLIPYLAEAARMLERGDASAKDIDIAMKLGAGYPMGPLELLDYVGLDTTKFVLDGWHEKFPENPLFSPISLVDKLVSEGKLGKKSGEGFYSYKKNNGPYAIPVHSPYFESFSTKAEKVSVENPNPPSPPPPPTTIQPKLDTLKRDKTQKLDTGDYWEDPNGKGTKLFKRDKPRRFDRLRTLEKWKNSEEFLSERDRQSLNFRKASAKQTTKHVENYVSRAELKKRKSLLSSEDFVQFKRLGSSELSPSSPHVSTRFYNFRAFG